MLNSQGEPKAAVDLDWVMEDLRGLEEEMPDEEMKDEEPSQVIL
jgi:hypothetical protein